MATLSTLKLTIPFGVIPIDIRIGPAMGDGRPIAGRKMCAEHKVPVTQEWRCPEHGDEPCTETVIGYPVEGDRFVVPDNSHIEGIKPVGNSDPTIRQFVPAESIEPMYYDKTYLTEPQSDIAAAAFDLFTETLRRRKLVAVCTATLWQKERMVIFAWSPLHGSLVMRTCRFAADVRWDHVEQLRQAKEARSKPEKSYFAMADALVDSMTGDFEPEKFTDDYREVLQRLIEAADAGKPYAAVKGAKAVGTPRPDLLAALKESVKQVDAAKKKKSATKKKKSSATV